MGVGGSCSLVSGSVFCVGWGGRGRGAVRGSGLCGGAGVSAVALVRVRVIWGAWVLCSRDLIFRSRGASLCLRSFVAWSWGVLVLG